MKNPTIVFIFILCLILKNTSAFSDEQAAYQYNQKGIECMQAGRFEEAIEALKTAHRYLPSNETVKRNLCIAYNNYGFSLMKKGDYSSAIEQYENAIYYGVDIAYTYYNLGQAYYMTQDMSKARDALEKAYSLNPKINGLNELLRKARGEEKVENRLETVETMHFVLACPPDTDRDAISFVQTQIEEAYGKIAMFLDHAPRNKTVVIIYPEEAYARLLGGRPSWGLATFDGKVRIPARRIKYSGEDVLKMIYHEYAHAVILDMARGRCPNWFSEGVASKAEDFGAAKDRDVIRKYIERYGIIPIDGFPADFSRVRDMNRAVLMYIEAYLVVDFLQRTSGNSGVRDVLIKVGQGMGLKQAIESVTGDSFAGFEQKWKAYVIDEYRISMDGR